MEVAAAIGFVEVFSFSCPEFIGFRRVNSATIEARALRSSLGRRWRSGPEEGESVAAPSVTLPARRMSRRPRAASRMVWARPGAIEWRMTPSMVCRVSEMRF